MLTVIIVKFYHKSRGIIAHLRSFNFSRLIGIQSPKHSYKKPDLIESNPINIFSMATKLKNNRPSFIAVKDINCYGLISGVQFIDLACTQNMLFPTMIKLLS